MAFTKYCSVQDAQVLDVKGSATRLHLATLDKVGDYSNYRTGDGYMYVRLRAISSRVNKNHDGWPSIELAGGPKVFERVSRQSSTGYTLAAKDGDPEYGFATFLGKPNFIDHNNSDPERSRGVIVDSKCRVLPMEHLASFGDDYWTSGTADPEHLPPTEIELLIEIDAHQFPKYASAVRKGEIDGFSMGCDVDESKCSHCGHVATNPTEYCSHILMKGAHHDFKTADGQRISKKSYENCYGIKFFEISAVFEPADETALAREVVAAIQTEGMRKGAPDPGDDTYFGGEAGSSRKAYDAMIKEYGHEKGEEVYYATRNKKKGKHAHRLAEHPDPQSMETKAPDEVDTMRQEKVCPLCGETMEGHSCDVCGFEEPPEGMGNPDLEKAKKVREEAAEHDEQEELNPAPESPPGSVPQPQPGGAPVGQEENGPQHHQHPPAGSFLQTRNRQPTGAVMSEMRWAPRIDEKLAGRINKQEVPIKGTPAPTGQPTQVTVVKSPTQPVTAAMRNAQELIQATNQTGDTIMSTQHTADGATPPSDTAADTRVDVTGVGGVIEPSNDAASKADAQVDVTGIGSTGVTDVEADETDTLPTASETSDDSGFNEDKIIEAIPTKTYGDSDGTEKGFTDPVTDTAYPQDAEVYKGSKVSYDAKPFYDQPGLSGGSANKGTEPSDPVGKAEDRVDVLQAAATPENNSGPTKTWSGTDGNAIYRQQDPVTNESIALGESNGNNGANWTSHVVACLKLADLEVDLDLTPKEQKYARIAELDKQSDAEIVAQFNMLSRVRTAGLAKLASRRQAGVTKLPAAFGGSTAAGRRFASAVDGELIEDAQQPQELAEDQLDASLFS
jgi:hypothetical protein